MVDYHPFSDAIFDDPYPIYKQLRDESPVHYLEEFDCWFVSRFEDVWNLEQDQRNLTSKFGTTSTHLVTKQTPISPNLSGLDPPQHGPVRSFFNPPFKPGAVAALEPRVRAFAREAIDCGARARHGRRGDRAGRYVSSRVVCTILGLPLEDADQVLAWVNTYFEREPGRRGSTPRGIDAAKEFAMYLFRLSKEMRSRGAPPGSLMHKLHTEEIAGERADDMRVAVHLNMLAIGGTETFPKVFSAALSRLAQHPDQRAACARDPSLIPDAFHETLRIDMPTQMLGRTIARDFELRGKKLRGGQRPPVPLGLRQPRRARVRRSRHLRPAPPRAAHPLVRPRPAHVPRRARRAPRGPHPARGSAARRCRTTRSTPPASSACAPSSSAASPRCRSGSRRSRRSTSAAWARTAVRALRVARRSESPA